MSTDAVILATALIPPFPEIRDCVESNTLGLIVDSILMEHTFSKYKVAIFLHCVDAIEYGVQSMHIRITPLYAAIIASTS